jgi:prepilin-type processing-associated H-X9-DG protein
MCDGHWPTSATAPLGSLCDQSVETRDALFKEIATSASTPPETYKKPFYCPANSAQDPAKLWTTAGISTWGYAWMNDRGTAGAALPATFPPHKAPLRYLPTVGGPDAANTVLAADVVVTDTDTPPLNFTPKRAAVNFGSNHISGKTVPGANNLMADGHVSWIFFNSKTATPVKQPAGGFFWFPNP